MSKAPWAGKCGAVAISIGTGSYWSTEWNRILGNDRKRHR